MLVCAIIRRLYLKRYISRHESAWPEGWGKSDKKTTEKAGRRYPGTYTRRISPCVKEGFQTDVYVMAFPAPVEELFEPGIHTINILFLAGIPRFNGRNFTFYRTLI